MPPHGYTGFTYGAAGAAVPHEPATIPPERLWAEYIAPRRPVILDGLLPQDTFHAARWTHLPYLAALAGDVPVRVEPRHPSGQFGTAIPRRTMRFGQFVESLGPDADRAQRGTAYLTTQYDAPPDADPAAPSDAEDAQEDAQHEPARLGKRRRRSPPSDDRSSPAPSTVSLTPSESEMDPLLPAPCNALVGDFPPQPALMGNLLLQQVNLWLGSSPDPDGATASTVVTTAGQVGQTSGLHHDFHDNLYVLLRGEKRFVLFPPDAHAFLHLRGDVARVHHNGLIVYDQDDDDDGGDDDDDDDDDGDGDSDDQSLGGGLVRGTAPSAADLIRADGLPEAQAEKWRVRARVRRVQEMEDALALSHGGKEAQRARHKRKGKARMSCQLAEALEQVADAQRGYELAKLYELGVRPVGGSDFGSDSGLSSSSEFESSDDESEDEEEVHVQQRRKGASSAAPRNGAESDTSVDEDELAMLLDDATAPLPPHLVAYLKQQQANGGDSDASSDDGQSKTQDISPDEEEDDEDDEDDDGSGVEEDELAALLAEATEPVQLPPADAESGSSESEDTDLNGELTRAQLEQLKARFGAAGSVGDESEDVRAGSDERQLTTPMLREAVALANPEGPLADMEEEDLRSLVYDIPRAWAAAGASIFAAPLAAHLRDVWELLDQAGDSQGESEAHGVDGDDDDEDDDGEGLPLFDDAGSMASLDLRNAEDGEAYLAGLGDDGAAPPEPPSFSRIKPQDLWEHFGLSAQETNGKTGKKTQKTKKSKGKFEPQTEVPLPGCPPPMVAQLKPGQMLYLPASWFHEVTSYASAPGDVHMALNYWFHPPTNTVGAPVYRRKKRAAAGSAEAADVGSGLPPPLAFAAPYLDTEVADEVRAAIQAKLSRAQEQGEKYASAVAGTAVAQQADKVAGALIAQSSALAREASEDGDGEGETVDIDLSQLPPEKVAALLSVVGGAESSEEDEPTNGRHGKGRMNGRHQPRPPSSEPDDLPKKKHKKSKKKGSKKSRHDGPGNLDERPSKRRRT